MAYKHIKSDDFNGPVWLGIIVCFVVGLLVGSITGSVRKDIQKDLQHKKVFYLALEGATLEYLAKEFPVKPDEDAQVAFSLRELHENGAQWAEFFRTEKLYREIKKEKTSEKWTEFKLAAITADKSATQILELVETRIWNTLSDEERKQIPDVLASKAAVPEIDTNYPKLPNGFYTWWILITQFACFGFYLIYWFNDLSGNYRWYHLPWGKPGVTIKFLLLLPGALPLMVLALVFQALTTDFAEMIANRRKKSGNNALGPQGTGKYNFDAATRQSQELAERLRKRLAGGGS